MNMASLINTDLDTENISIVIVPDPNEKKSGLATRDSVAAARVRLFLASALKLCHLNDGDGSIRIGSQCTGNLQKLWKGKESDTCVEESHHGNSVQYDVSVL